jgi:hypothetical protein
MAFTPLKMSKKGGHPVDEFVHTHFTSIGEKTATKRWNMQCNYCSAETVKLIVHWDSRCLSHLAKTEDGFCAHAPPEVQKEARQRLMTKGGSRLQSLIRIIIRMILSKKLSLQPLKRQKSWIKMPNLTNSVSR